jgi:hypothetical protein
VCQRAGLIAGRRQSGSDGDEPAVPGDRLPGGYSDVQFSATTNDPARVLTAHVGNKVVVFEIPPRTAYADFPTKMIRRAPEGRIISSTR